ncbi:MAG: hypothetical protein FWE97_04360, partial [Dehalococcoidia bacterium]|nr:hypothetical protein [Dehalococcoidia bacterium]
WFSRLQQSFFAVVPTIAVDISLESHFFRPLFNRPYVEGNSGHAIHDFLDLLLWLIAGNVLQLL